MSELITALEGVKSLLWQHSGTAHSHVNSGVFYSLQETGLSQSMVCFSVSDFDRSALIERLFGAGSPAAVFGTVSKIVINAIYGVILGWRLTHVFNKILEAVFPLPTDSNSSLEVVFVRRVFTTFIHRTPSIIGTCFRLSMTEHLVKIP